MTENKEEENENILIEPDGDLTLEYLGLYYYAQLEEALSQLVFEEEKVRGNLKSILIAEEDVKNKLKDIEKLLKDNPEFNDYKKGKAMYVERDSKIERLMEDMDLE